MGEVLNDQTQVPVLFMKITDLDKQQLLELMKSNGDIHRFNRDSYTWKHAFKLARLNGMEHLEMDCHKCIDKVKEWLIK